jgi:hypothetical protein
MPKDANAVRSMTHAEIVSRLEAQLIAIAGQGAAPIQGPINQNTPIITLGLDSMTIVQFKGLMEKRYMRICVCAFNLSLCVHLTDS